MIWKSYSKSYPEQIMMIETDRQNSTTTCFPYFARPPNESTSYQKFELCFQGFVINGNHFYCNILLPLHGKNANCNITARWKHLINYCRINQGLPPILRGMFHICFLKFVFFVFFLLVLTDNCASENKCKSIFTFYCWLLMNDFIQIVNLIYPFVGHSHGSCDSIFGIISNKFKNIKRIVDFNEVKEVSYFFICIFVG